jgi:hypothetical protein
VGILSGSATAEIDAPPERCYEIAAGDDITEWQKGLDRADVLQRDALNRMLVVDMHSDAKVRMIRTRVRFTHEPPGRMRWELVEGDLNEMRGSWTFEDIGGGRTRATYTLAIDPGRMLGLLLRGPVEQIVRDMLVSGRPNELKARAEAEAEA